MADRRGDAMAQLMNFVRASLFASFAALSLGACASDTTNYPSLARRPAERIAAQPPKAPAPATTIPADAALPARLAKLVDEARAAHARFGDRRPMAERAIAAGGGAAMGSEGWSIASVALADLESARSEAMVPLADLDQLLAAKLVADGSNGDSGDGAAIAAARLQVSQLIAEEDRVLAALRGRLGG